MQPIVALFTTEAEYIVAIEAIKEALCLNGLLKQLGVIHDKITLHSESQSVIHLSKNPVFYERTKYVDVRRHFIRDVIEDGVVKLEKIPTAHNPADMATKVLPLTKFKHCMDLVQLGHG